jgi:POT family proton-dependent oligopeptide transporter
MTIDERMLDGKMWEPSDFGILKLFQRTAMLSLLRQQPRPFYMIFILEMWERFGFYTVQGILTLYFIRYLGFDEQVAYYTFGAFSALVYGMLAVGGYLGDKVLGTKRTIVLGLITLASGYLALALVDKSRIFLALGLICVGNGLFKANPASLLSKCYQERDPRLHQGFTLYYMAINLGSTIALFLGPTLSRRYGYSYAYLASFVGILLALANYMAQRKHVASIHTPADKRPILLWQWNLVILGIVVTTWASAYLLQHVNIAKDLVLMITVMVVFTYFTYMRREPRPVFLKMLVAFILMLEAVAFFTLYQQMPTSLNLFAVNNVNPELMGLHIDPQSFQALNPIWIIALSPLVATVYQKLHQRGISFSTPYKFTLGMFCCGLSFLSLYFSRYIHDAQGMVSSGWLVASYLLQSLGELLVSALGVAMVAELVPSRISGFVMGMWYLTSAMAGFTGALVASFTILPKSLPSHLDSLQIYTEVFGYVGLTTLVIAVCMGLVSPYLSRLMKN